MQAVERTLGAKDPLKSSAGFSKDFQEKALELEKMYQCKLHPLERIKFYCNDCRQAIC